MSTISVQEAQTRLSELIRQLSPDEEVVITEGDRPVARLIPTPSPERRSPRLGTLRGTVLNPSLERPTGILIPGQVVEVEVQRVAVFGAFCRCRGQEVLLLIPETSWVASYCSCDQFAEPGDRLAVKILHVDPNTGQASATIRGLHPNPWENGSLVPGREYLARVVRSVAAADRCGGRSGALLELIPGSFVMLCDGEQRLESGRTVRVVICESDPLERSVTVALCDELERRFGW